MSVAWLGSCNIPFTDGFDAAAHAGCRKCYVNFASQIAGERALDHPHGEPMTPRLKNRRSAPFMPFEIEAIARCFPVQIDMPLFVRQRTVFCGVGAEFMERHGDCDRCLGRQLDFGARGGDAIGVAAELRGCRANQLGKCYAFPMFAGQPIGARAKRLR